MNLQLFEGLSERILNIKLSENLNINTKTRLIYPEDLLKIDTILENRIENQNTQTPQSSAELEKSLWEKSKILSDVYTTLKTQHYDGATLSNEELIEGAIIGLTQSVWDEYTTFFPATDSDNFFEGLDGEYEWIGAYVDMTTPGELIIVSPIVWSPAQKSGLYQQR